MNPASPDIAKPGAKEISNGIRTDQGDHRQLINGVVGAVTPIVPSFTRTDAHPITSDTPIAASSELEAVGAERVGSEKFTLNENLESGDRDIKDFRNWFISKLKGGGSKIRLAPGKLVSKIKRIRASQEAKVVNKYDSSQLDTE